MILVEPLRCALVVILRLWIPTVIATEFHPEKRVPEISTRLIAHLGAVVSRPAGL